MVDNILRHPDCAVQYDSVQLFELPPGIQLEVLGDALADLVRRHVLLRAVITAEQGEFRQAWQASAPEVEVEPVGRRSADDIAAELVASRLDTEQVLAGGRLFRPRIFDTGTAALLALTVNHFVFDGWCEQVMWRDLAEIYAARVENRSPVLPPLRFSYLDFIQQQRDGWADDGPAVRFWTARLEGYQGDIGWLRSPRLAAAPTGPTRRTSVPLSPTALAGVRRASRATRSSRFTVLLAVTALALSRATGQRDLLLGTDTASREGWERQDVIGAFVNARLTRPRVDRAGTFPDLVRYVKAEWAASEPYRDAYLARILGQTGSPRMLKVNHVTGLEVPAPALGGRPLSPIPVPVITRSWRGPLVVWSADGPGCQASISHRPDIVPADEIAELAAQLAAICAAPEVALC